MTDTTTQPQYAYSLQWHNTENYKIRDRVFEGQVYTDLDKFIHHVNEEIKEGILDYEDIELEEGQTFTNDNSKYYLDCYPITKEYINNINCYEYVYYSDTWAYIIAKHTII